MPQREPPVKLPNSVERGCVVFDQPQHSQFTLRLIAKRDTAALLKVEVKAPPSET